MGLGFFILARHSVGVNGRKIASFVNTMKFLRFLRRTNQVGQSEGILVKHFHREFWMTRQVIELLVVVFQDNANL